MFKKTEKNTYNTYMFHRNLEEKERALEIKVIQFIKE